MKYLITFLNLVVMFNSYAIAGTTAFTNVNVIPMDTERVLENHTIIVEGNRITAIGPVNEVTVPAGAKVIEGEGAYLMPGLADMHMHFGEDEKTFKLFIANGVTTVRDTAALPLYLQWKKEIAAGTKMGPQIYAGRMIHSYEKLDRIIHRSVRTIVLGLILFLVVWLVFRKRIAKTGKKSVINLSLLAILFVISYILSRTVIPTYQVATPGYGVAFVDSPWEARNAVYEAKDAGYDFIKPYDQLSQASYEALMNAARETDMYVAGHIPEALGLDGIIAHGQDEVVHLEELLNDFFGGGYEKGQDALPFDWPLEERRIKMVVKKLKDSNITLCATMITDEDVLKKITNPADFLRDPIIEKYLWRHYYEGIKDGTDRHLRAFKDRFPNNIERWYPLYKKILAASKKAGVKITLGTDAGVEGVVHGFTIHDELRILTETGGFTPYEAIAAGTKVAAESMKDSAEWGTIEVGKQADLILVNKNPLEDVAHIQDKRGVMVAGRWYLAAELNDFLKESEVGP
jgi:imidazolonepropionase-like amidohydrolase